MGDVDNYNDNINNNGEASDIVDEYVLDLDDDNDQEFNSQPKEEDLPSSSKDSIINPLGEEMFSPLNIRHPRSSEW